MKKIMFNDKLSLTQAVLEGRKTQTRRIYKTPENAYGGLEIEGNNIISFDANGKEIVTTSKYKVGEVIAVAQSYSFIVDELENCNNATCAEHYEKNVEKGTEYISWMEHPGFNNKMFVCADLMPHRICITNVRVERLQDISDEDCLKEGLEWDGVASQYYVNYQKETGHKMFLGKTLREAFAHLIDKVSGKGTWNSNPYVFVYDFRLIK